MKDETKEILDYLKEFAYKCELEDIYLNKKRIIQLLDYITNLQEENERLKIEKQEEYNRFNLMAKFRDKALARELIYKSRNKKAIEFLEQNLEGIGYVEVCELLNILQGEENDK